jgi:hypothetical protein
MRYFGHIIGAKPISLGCFSDFFRKLERKYPQNPACPVQFFAEDERSEFNRGLPR